VRSLLWYPRGWRRRYGAELVALMDELGDRERSLLSTRLDLARCGLAERFRILAPGPLPPRERGREGALLVLYAWVLFVIGGCGIAKLSEHWDAVTPVGKQSLPAHAFGVLTWAAVAGSALVLAGVALALPALVALVRRGGAADLRRPLARAVVLSSVGIACTVALSRWAHTLSSPNRNGHDGLYSAAFAVVVLVGVACLFAWASAAASIARRLPLTRTIVRLEGVLAAVVALTMVVMALATVIWWAALAGAAPWFFAGRPAGSAGAQALEPNMIVASALMLAATILALLGAERSLNGSLRA